MKDGYVSLDSTFESTNPDYRNQYSTTAGFSPNYIHCMICKLNSSTKKKTTRLKKLIMNGENAFRTKIGAQ